MTKINQQNAQINSGLTPWWWLRLRGRNMLEWLIS